MGCVNCQADERAYTLHAHVDGEERTVELSFCSADCLDDWT